MRILGLTPISGKSNAADNEALPTSQQTILLFGGWFCYISFVHEEAKADLQHGAKLM